MPVYAHNENDRNALILRLNILQVLPSGPVADACKEDILRLLRPDTKPVAPPAPEDEEEDPRH